MTLARGISYATLLLMLIAIIVIATGQKQAVNDLLGAGEQGNKARSQAFSKSPLGRARLTESRAKLNELTEKTIFATVGSTSTNRAALLNKLDSNDTRLIKQGKIKLFFYAQGQIVIFCQSSARFIHVCSGINLRTRQENTSENNTLSKTLKQSKQQLSNSRAIPPGVEAARKLQNQLS